MKSFAIILVAALLAIAPGSGSAQQSAEIDQSAPNEPVKQFVFPENQSVQEFKFPENQAVQEFKFPEKPKGETRTSPAMPENSQKES